MTLTELRYLLALDVERHFGRAAERCHVTQPTLSVALRKLEEQLGVTLFERVRGEARPTHTGELVIEQARVVLDEASKLESIAKAGQDPLDGPLRVGAIYTIGPYLMPHLVPLMRERAPRMPLVIEENFTAVLSRQLRNNELDAIIVAEPFSLPAVETTELFDEEFVAVLPAEHEWRQRDAVAATELADQNLLLLGPGHCFRDQVIAACPECEEREDRRPLVGSSLETIRHMVASGLGITVLPLSSIENRPDEDSSLLITRPFNGPVPQRRVLLAWRNSFTRPAAIETLRQAVLDSGLRGVSMRH